MASLALSALLLGGCGGSDGSDEGDGAYSPDGKFVSTSDVQGEVAAFATPARLKIEGASVVWQASCNTAGTTAEITADQLIIDEGKVALTAMGCPGKNQQQDEELIAFFGSDPNWELDGDRLTLSNDSVTVVLLADDDRYRSDR